MPYSKTKSGKYKSPSGRVYSKKQMQAIEIAKHKKKRKK